MELTPRQKSVFDVICKYHRLHGFSPTVREICDQLGLAGPAGVHRILGILEEKGYLQSTAGKSRSWRPTGAGRMFMMPVVGRIAAGDPLDIWDHFDERIPVDPALYGHKECFALKVKGDSMIGEHILDGDLAVIRPQPDVMDNQIAAVLVEDRLVEATLKKVRKKRGVLELHAANPAFSVMTFSQKSRKKVRIIGQCVGLIRRMNKK